jgi:hypothetical protein
MVGGSMKLEMTGQFTLLETLKTSNGNTIIYQTRFIPEFFKSTFQENHANLTQEEIEESFMVNEKYGDLIIKILKKPLQQLLGNQGAGWALQSDDRNPIEEYEHHLSLEKDEDLTDEQHNMKMERLRLHREWFEKQNQ